LRLEIETKKDRDYEWVVHHVDRPTEVGFREERFREAPAADRMADRTWYYDAPHRNLRVRVRAKAGDDSVVELVF
jgi:hypothetical protein